MLTLTEQAQEVIRGIVAEADVGPDGGLRIAATSGNGEMGLEFSIADSAEDGDETVDSGGARVFLDADASRELSDKTLDVEAHGDHFHFSLEEQNGSAS
jgi:iron-sulfur cluster assembly protein